MDLNKKDKEQQELLEKTFFSYVGYQHVQNINQEINDNRDEIEDVKVSDSLDERVSKRIKEIENPRRNSKFRNIFNFRVRKVATIFFVFIASMMILTLSVDAFRVGLFNLIIKERENFLEVSVEEQESGQKIGEVEGYYVPLNIPEGFELDSIDSTSRTKTLTYINQKGQSIIFDQAPNGFTKYQLDSEDALVEDVLINDIKGIFIEKEKDITIFWNNDEFSFVLLAEDVKIEELLKMAESIRKQ